MKLDYRIIDVFTERVYGGNPLAVVLGADRLSPPEMQAIAREFNLSETTFVLEAQRPAHTARVRIFTPWRELAFAGHPTLGTALVLAELRTPAANGESDALVVLEEEIGSVRVGVRLRNGSAAYGEFDAPKLPEFAEAFSFADETPMALGLNPADIGFENHKPLVLRGSSTFAFVPVSNLEAMAKTSPDHRYWASAFSERGVDGVYLYTRQCVRAGTSFHTRMFAPDMGIPEDAATGSAAIGFARVIHTFDGLLDGSHKRLIEQGLEMGRPSAIHLVMNVQRGSLAGVRIGGHGVPVMQGQIIA